jgi:predicted nucleic-acid-binding protein
VIGLDTNVLVRYFMDETSADVASRRQHEAARRLVESGQAVMICKSVLLELEWVLRSYYTLTAAQVLEAMEFLLDEPHITIEAREQVAAALKGYREGLDFADALHHASYRDCTRMASFDDRRFARRAKRMGLIPSVSLPA